METKKQPCSSSIWGNIWPCEDHRVGGWVFVSIKTLLLLKRMQLPISRATKNTKATVPVVLEAVVKAGAIGVSAEEEEKEEEAKTLIISISPRVWRIAWIILGQRVVIIVIMVKVWHKEFMLGADPQLW